MKTILPIPERPFTEDELAMLTERLEIIEAALEGGKVVVATRPHKITDGLTHKVIREIKFHPQTDADLITATGGCFNLLDETYCITSYAPEEMPDDIAESMCLAHLVSLREIFNQSASKEGE